MKKYLAYKRLCKAYDFLDQKKYRKAIDIFEKEVDENSHELIYVAMGNAYFALKEWDLARYSFHVYVGVALVVELSPKDLLFVSEKEHRISVVARKASRCTYELHGIKVVKKELKELFNKFGHPNILEQLAVFMRESGYEKTAKYYDDEAGKIRKILEDDKK